ncbi:YjjW family glycine radical enzyme activase [Psychromonas hadalis]|uniref:YjjW family glycine radical enzyme activase n=1 Tax=Psychromonas hadalis TaxID=211669 RepID=UPI0003B3A8BE|nr:YjjW family glycine radical enzyme activase [Psychromonas hadalis]
MLQSDTINFDKKGIISKILTFSCVDGPGNRLVIFLQGCNFDCISCHNPHTINHCDHCADCVASCPTGALTVENNKVKWRQALCSGCDKCIDICPSKSTPKTSSYSVRQLLELLTQHRHFLNGITVSGGESTLQLAFLVELFKAVKANAALSHLSCYVDSNGSLSEQGWNKLLPYIDGTMIDLKAWQNATHLWLVGRGNHRVMQTINQLAAHNKLYEVRLLYIPGKTDLLSEIDALCEYLNTLPQQVIIRLNAFQHHGVIGEGLTWDKCSEQQMLMFSKKLVARLGREVLLPSVYT